MCLIIQRGQNVTVVEHARSNAKGFQPRYVPLDIPNERERSFHLRRHHASLDASFQLLNFH